MPTTNMPEHEEQPRSGRIPPAEPVPWPWNWDDGHTVTGGPAAWEDPANRFWDALRQAELLMPIERFLVRYTGISLVTYVQRRWQQMPYAPTLLFLAVGRKSGRLIPTTVVYYRDGRDFVIVGSAGGGPRDPQWVENLRANPQAWVWANRKHYVVRAHVAESEERERLWSLVTQGSTFATYQEKAWPREIPVVVMRPTA